MEASHASMLQTLTNSRPALLPASEPLTDVSPSSSDSESVHSAEGGSADGAVLPPPVQPTNSERRIAGPEKDDGIENINENEQDDRDKPHSPQQPPAQTLDHRPSADVSARDQAKDNDGNALPQAVSRIEPEVSNRANSPLDAKETNQRPGNRPEAEVVQTASENKQSESAATRNDGNDGGSLQNNKTVLESRPEVRREAEAEQKLEQRPEAGPEAGPEQRHDANHEAAAASKILTASLSSDSRIGATVPGDGHVCANCKATQTPLWRRGPNGQVLCNACGLYIKARNIHRPLTLKRSPNTKKVPLKNAVGSCPGDGRCNGTGGSQSCKQCPSFLNNSRRNKNIPGYVSNDDVKMISCQNCGTVNTPLWRRDVQGHVICNACGLYNRMHKDGRPAGLQTAIVKRRKRNRMQSEGSGSQSDSDIGKSDAVPESSESKQRAPSQAGSALLVPLQPRAAPKQPSHSHGDQVPLLQRAPATSPHAHHHSHSSNSSNGDANDGQPHLCCSHLNPGMASSTTPEYQQPPAYGYPAGQVPTPHQQAAYGYLPVPSLQLPGLPPANHFAVGHMPPFAQIPFGPFGQQQTPPILAPQQVSHQVPQQAPQPVPQQVHQPLPQQISQQIPHSLQQQGPIPQPRVPLNEAQPQLPQLRQSQPPPSSSHQGSPAVLQHQSRDSPNDRRQPSSTPDSPLANTSSGVKRNFDKLSDEQGDSPLAVLQYLKEASQDTKKEYLLAAQRQLMDKIAQYKHRLGAAEYQLSMCESALKTINEE